MSIGSLPGAYDPFYGKKQGEQHYCNGYPNDQVVPPAFRARTMSNAFQHRRLVPVTYRTCYYRYNCPQEQQYTGYFFSYMFCFHISLLFKLSIVSKVKCFTSHISLFTIKHRHNLPGSSFPHHLAAFSFTASMIFLISSGVTVLA